MRLNILRFLQLGHKTEWNHAPDKVGNFHRILPQFLSSFAQHFINWDMGMVLAIPSLVVPSVIGISADLNPDEILKMSPDEASWLASILFIVQPIGNLLSGFIMEYLGRKRAIFVVNLMLTLAWILLPNSQSQYMTYVAFSLLGIGLGLTSAVTYISEISEPKLRGILSAISGISSSAGIFMIYLLGSYLSWRKVAYACAIIPVLNTLTALFIPEAPIWLVAKNRPEDAQRSLQLLRGGVSVASISDEFEELKSISAMSMTCANCEKSGQKCDHAPPTLLNKLKDMTKKRTLKPFVLVSMLFLLMQFSGMCAMRPYIVQILNAHGIALGTKLTTIFLGVLGILANICIVFTISKLGKRRLYLYAMVGNIISCFGLSVYGWVFFPRNWSSINTDANGLETFQASIGNYNYIALIMFSIMHFCISLGVASVPYIIATEIFPFKSRSFYCGIVSAESQLFAFIATKTYYDIERWLSLPGVMFFYGVVAVFGFILMFCLLPETEHRSLNDIELHYSDNKRSIFDIDIKINSVQQTKTV